MREYGRKPYMSKSYNEMMKRITNKAMYNIRPEKHSEFEKPYRADSYSDMQHYYPTNHLPGADYPGMPVSGIPVDAYEPWTVLFACAGNLCYCEGTTRCAQIVCNQQVIGIEPHFCDSCVTITYSGNEVCVTVAEGCGVGVCGFDVLMLATTVSGKVIYGRNQLSLSECGDCCVCAGISIGHTTHQMAVDEQQNLTATGAVAGCTYAWAIASGGGELSAAEGTEVTYTAPSSNADCDSNPTITLTVEGTVCDTLQIAIYEGGVGLAAFSIFESVCYGDHYCRERSYGVNCGGDVTEEIYISTCNDEWVYCDSDEDCSVCRTGVRDIRSVEQLAAGCCPYQLM